MHADRDINIGAGQTTQLEIQGKQTTSKGTFKSSTTTTNSSAESTTSVGSSFSGGTVAMTANNDITIEGSHISGTNGVLVDAGRNLTVYEGRNTSSASLETDTQTRGIGFGGGSLPIVGPVKKGSGTGIEVSSDTASASTIQSSQGGVLLQGGGTVTLQGVQVDAAKDITIHGANVDIHAAVDGQSLAIAHKSNDLNLGSETWYRDPSTGFNAKKTQEAGITDTSLARTTLNGANVNITAEDTLAMAGTTVNTPGKLSLTADTLVLGTQATEHGTQETSQGRDLMYQKAKDKGTTDQTTNYNQFNAGSLAVSANHVQAGVGARDSIEQLAQLPGMGWIEQLQNDPNLSGKVDWVKVEEAHKNWNYSQQGLTPEGAAIVTVVVSYFTWGAANGAGTAAGGAVGGGTTGAVVGGAVTAGVSALAGQASVALINNQGDIGKALDELGSSSNVKNLLTDIATGGVLGGLNLNPTGLPTASGSAQEFMKQLGQNLTASAATAVISTAINGGSLEENLKQGLKTALLNTIAAQGANAIGDLTKDGTLDDFTNKIAHAIAGCAVGAARTDGSCAAGALGAAIGELAAEGYGRQFDTIQFAAMVSGIAGAIAGLDADQINLASQAGANAAANNFLSHDQWKQLADEIAACQKNGCPSEKERELQTRYLEISNSQDKALLAACQAGSPQCKTFLAAALDGAATQHDLIVSGKLPDYYWGGSDFSGTAKLLSSPQFKGATSEQAAQMAAKLGGIILDFVPVIGDIKGFVEAQTPFDYTLAAVGTLGPLGDGVAKLIKEAKIAAEAGDAVKAINKLAEAESVIKATPGPKGSWDAALNGQLAPKTTYELTNGHKYVTDANGSLLIRPFRPSRRFSDHSPWPASPRGSMSRPAARY